MKDLDSVVNLDSASGLTLVNTAQLVAYHLSHSIQCKNIFYCRKKKSKLEPCLCSRINHARLELNMLPSH